MGKHRAPDSPYSFPCDYCLANIEQDCKTYSGKICRLPHENRRDKWDAVKREQDREAAEREQLAKKARMEADALVLLEQIMHEQQVRRTKELETRREQQRTVLADRQALRNDDRS